MRTGRIYASIRFTYAFNTILIIEVNSFYHKGQKLLCYKNKEAVFQELRQTPVHPF